MIRAIIAWSLQNRMVVLLGMVALVGAGTYSAMHLDIEAYPDPTPPLVEVIAQNPGWSPEEMERLVAVPLETALNGMPGLADLRSTTMFGLTDIKCRFTYGTDYRAARQEVLNRLAMADLPEGVRPELSPWSPTGEIVRYILEGPGYTLAELKAVQDWVLERALKQVPGVIDVVSFGGAVKQYQVLLDTRLMRQYGVTLEQVEDAIARSNANVGGDVLALGEQVHNVRAIGLLGGGVDALAPEHASRRRAIEAEKVDDVRRVVVASSPDGTPITLDKVARVVVGHKPRLGIVGRDGDDDVVEGIILKRRVAPTLPTADLAAAYQEAIEDERLLPEGMRVTVFYQRADLVHVTTENVLHNLGAGVLLVTAVLFVFLGDAASALIVALVIPLALLFAVTLLHATGQSANLLSLGAVDFGIIVDSSVIIVEAIHRHMGGEGGEGSVSDRILAAAEEVGRPLFYSTAIIVCAFLPLFTMTGPAGALFGPMAATYALSIAGALGLALTVSPVLCSFFLRPRAHDEATRLDRLMRWAYLGVLDRALAARGATLALAGVLLVGTAALVPGLGAEFMPALEEGNLWIRAVLPQSVSLDEAARVAPEIRRAIAETPEVRGVVSQLGRPDDGTDVTGFFNLEYNVPLRPMDEWRPGLTRADLEAEILGRLRRFPGIDFGASQMIRDNIDEALSGIKGANSVKVFGDDLGRLQELGKQVVDRLRSVPGIGDVGMLPLVGQPNLEIRIDRSACARFGLNVDDVQEMVRVAVGGRAFSEMIEGEKRYDIVLRLPEDLRNDPADIARIPIDVPARGDRPASRVLLSQVASIRPHEPGASFIYRENNRRYAPIRFSVAGRDLASGIAEARSRVEGPGGVDLPRGYRVDWAGEFAQMQDAYARLRFILPLSLALILVLLYTLFGSARDPLLVLAGVVPAVLGGIWALRLTGTTFSVSAAVGFVSIFGVAVQNGVLLVAYFNQRREENTGVVEAVRAGAALRLRPVTMTSLTAALGLLPAALATSIGSQAQKPLAIVVVGGISAAWLLTLVLVPTLYTLFARDRPDAADDRGLHDPDTDPDRDV